MQNEQNQLAGEALPKTNEALTTLVKNLTPLRSCPNCDKEWSKEEVEFQACDDCGYPLHREQNDFTSLVFDFSSIEPLH